MKNLEMKKAHTPTANVLSFFKPILLPCFTRFSLLKFYLMIVLLLRLKWAFVCVKIRRKRIQMTKKVHMCVCFYNSNDNNKIERNKKKCLKCKILYGTKTNIPIVCSWILSWHTENTKNNMELFYLNIFFSAFLHFVYFFFLFLKRKYNRIL